MTFFQAVFLGVLQGLTEFLPISSTAHLRVVPAILGWQDPGAAFTAVTQLGTLAATIVFFRKDLWALAKGAVEGIRGGDPLTHQGSRLAFGILVGTLPIGVCGLLFKHPIKTHLRSLYVIAFALIVLALILWVAERAATHRRTMAEMTFKDAVLVGVAQTLALIPGASRSGTTLTAGLFLGLKRDAAARFSFLLSLPAVAAAGLFELKDVMKGGGVQGDILVPTVVATVVAFVSGLAAIAFLISYLQKRSTALFVGYRLVLGVLLLVLLITGKLSPMVGIAP